MPTRRTCRSEHRPAGALPLGLAAAGVLGGCGGAPTVLYEWAEEAAGPVRATVVAVGNADLLAGPLPCNAEPDEGWAFEPLTRDAPGRVTHGPVMTELGLARRRGWSEEPPEIGRVAGLFELVRYDAADGERLVALEFRPDEEAIVRAIEAFGDAGRDCFIIEAVVDIPEPVALDTVDRVLVRLSPWVDRDGVERLNSDGVRIRSVLDDLVDARVRTDERDRQRWVRLKDWQSFLLFSRWMTYVGEGWLRLGRDAEEVRSIRLRFRVDPA